MRDAPGISHGPASPLSPAARRLMCAACSPRSARGVVGGSRSVFVLGVREGSLASWELRDACTFFEREFCRGPRVSEYETHDENYLHVCHKSHPC